MGTYYIQEQNDELTRVGRGEFYDTLKDGGYLHYNEGGQHIALLRTDLNEATMRVCRQADFAERDVTYASENRCRDCKGNPCRFQHDGNGQVIRNEKGHPVHAKCSDCPRNGWIAGKRENCCIRQMCKIEDCAYCTHHREYSNPISLDWLTEENRDNDDESVFNLVDPDDAGFDEIEKEELAEALHMALGELSEKEMAVVEAVYWGEKSLRAYAAESGIPYSTVRRLHNSALAGLRTILKDFR